LTKVREKYLEAIDRLKTQRKIYIIDANDDIEKVFDKTKNIINKEF
jgi:thymidylate kinase